jgi:uncharacterized protein YcbK (DUF882 family)
MLGKLAVFVMILAFGFSARVEAQARDATAASAKSSKTTSKSAAKSATKNSARARGGMPAKKPAAKSAARRHGTATRSGAAARTKTTVTRRTVAARSPSARSSKAGSHRTVVARSGRYGKSAHRRTTPQMRTAAARRLAYKQGRGSPGGRGGTRFGYAPLLPPPDSGATRTLSFYNVHTRRAITVTFRRGGRYVQSELDRLNDFLRDTRNGEEVQMDPRLFDLLWQVRRQLRSSSPYQVLSAYRSPQTNAWLASVSSGVASNSMHMRGQAMDVRLADRTPGQIRRVARALNRGGVGYYPRSGFVHLDTGPVRYW